jgi:hypothetical protein
MFEVPDFLSTSDVLGSSKVIYPWYKTCLIFTHSTGSPLVVGGALGFGVGMTAHHKRREDQMEGALTNLKEEVTKLVCRAIFSNLTLD